MASVKNFQLVTPEDQDSVVLQFGRVAKDEFTMDFQWPMSPFQVLIHALYIIIYQTLYNRYMSCCAKSYCTV
jgi:Tub family